MAISPPPESPSETKLERIASESPPVSKQQARETDRFNFISELAGQSNTRQYFQYARYATREHDKKELTAGLIVGLIFAFIFGNGPWLNIVGIGLLAFGATLITIFLLHWIRARSVFHAHWEAKSKELLLTENRKTLGEQKRLFLAERLKSLLNEAGTVYSSGTSLRSIKGMAKAWRETAYHDRAKNLVKEHWGPETASRYDKEKSSLLESLLADLFKEKDDTKPDISGAIEDVIQKKLLPEQGQGIVGFDYYYTVRFWLRNAGAPSNFQNLSLSIFINKQSYAGERLPLAGYCLYKQVPTQSGAHTALEVTPHKLEDFDALSPLERNHTRYGWLRFVVRNVQWNQQDQSANRISHLELTVTDGSGGQTPIIDKSYSWRHENPPNLEVRRCPAGMGYDRPATMAEVDETLKIMESFAEQSLATIVRRGDGAIFTIQLTALGAERAREAQQERSQ